MAMNSSCYKQLIILVFLCFTSGNTSAHATVTKSSFDNQTLLADKPTFVSLFFNTLIKVPQSKVNLIGEGAKSSELTISRGKQYGELSVELPALKPGDYALQYKILAIDGHLTEDTLTFTIK